MKFNHISHVVFIQALVIMSFTCCDTILMILQKSMKDVFMALSVK